MMSSRVLSPVSRKDHSLTAPTARGMSRPPGEAGIFPCSGRCLPKLGEVGDWLRGVSTGCRTELLGCAGGEEEEAEAREACWVLEALAGPRGTSERKLRREHNRSVVVEMTLRMVEYWNICRPNQLSGNAGSSLMRPNRMRNRGMSKFCMVCARRRRISQKQKQRKSHQQLF